jgi:hypothetical protein
MHFGSCFTYVLGSVSELPLAVVRFTHHRRDDLAENAPHAEPPCHDQTQRLPSHRQAEAYQAGHKGQGCAHGRCLVRDGCDDAGCGIYGHQRKEAPMSITADSRPRAVAYARARLWPPLFAFVRMLMRFSVAGLFYALGYEQIAAVFAVMGVISLIATVEIQVAKDIAKTITSVGWGKLLPLPRRRRLGPPASMSEALELYADEEVAKIIDKLSKPGTTLSAADEKRLAGNLKLRRQRFRGKLVAGELVAFGTLPGGDEPHEIPAAEMPRLSMRFTEERLVDPNGTLDYRDVTVRKVLNPPDL